MASTQGCVSAQQASVPPASTAPTQAVAPTRGPTPTTALGASAGDISQIVAGSACAQYGWGNRGKAPRGYLVGVSRVFADSVCELRRGDAWAVAAARPLSNQPERVRDYTDALSWYASNLRKLGLAAPGGDVQTLRHLFALLIGLGMRESSGNYCTGRDLTANFKSASSAEAGAWQSSFATTKLHPALAALFARYRKQAPDGCYLATFKQGAGCPDHDAVTWGDGDGAAYQELSKSCPPFAAKSALIVMRESGGNDGEYGPLRTKAAEIRLECDQMLERIERSVRCD